MLWIALQPLPDGAETPAESTSVLQSNALLALAWHALAFTPRVTLEDEAVLMEISASVRLFGGTGRLLKRLQAAHAGPDSSPASLRFAQGPTALLALGRLRSGLPWRESSRCEPARLPLACLSAAREHLGVLERIGCRSWGDLRRLPRDGLARRFGQPLLDALDRAFGDQPESHSWLSLPEVFEAPLELPALVENANALMFGVNRLLMLLKAWLVAHSRGVLGVELSWLLDPRRDVPASGKLDVRMTEASQDMTHVARLMAEHLARVRLPAPAHTICLRSLETLSLTGSNHSLLPDECLRGDSLAQLIERLSARLGPQQVRRWQALADHVPERMQCWLPAQSANMVGMPPQGKLSRTKKTTRQSAEKALPDIDSCQPDALFPSWLLHEPLPLEMQGERPWHEGPLTLLAGPQRLEATGWMGKGGGHAGVKVRAPGQSQDPQDPQDPQEEGADRAAVMRDYFIARSDKAGLLWIYRERTGSAAMLHKQNRPSPGIWYLHGIFA
ncbi:MAG: DNA polymerase Y family protein [Pseudomonadota bacterium]